MMKQIIGGKRYNTETATKIGEASRGYGGDHARFECGLYKTRTGNYFLAGEGGPASMFAESVGNASIGGSGIIPLEEADALEFAERYFDAETIEEYFGHIITD